MDLYQRSDQENPNRATVKSHKSTVRIDRAFVQELFVYYRAIAVPRRNKVELRQLRFVKAVATTGSFSAAAEEEHITEPGLHKQVRKLEMELGIQLFERSGRSIRITSAGLQLLGNIDSILAGVRE